MSGTNQFKSATGEESNFLQRPFEFALKHSPKHVALHSQDNIVLQAANTDGD